MHERKGYLLIALAASMWGTSGIFVKLLYSYQFDPYSVAFLQAFFAFAITLVFALVAHRSALRISLKHLPFLASYGLVGVAIFPILFYQSFAATTVATATVLLATSPIFTMLLARVIFREPLTGRKIISFVLAMAGCALVVGLYHPGSLLVNTTGIIFGLATGFTYALFNLWGKKASLDYNPLTIVICNMGFGALFLLPIRPFSLLTLSSSPSAAWLLLVGLVVLVNIIPYTLYPLGLRYIEVGRASLVANVEPVVAAIIAFFVLGELLEPLQIVGAVVVISAAVLVQTSSQTEAVSDQPSAVSLPSPVED